MQRILSKNHTQIFSIDKGKNECPYYVYKKTQYVFLNFVYKFNFTLNQKNKAPLNTEHSNLP